MAATPKRPRLFVLAGVNGAGKSSVAGGMLKATGLTWFNPDSFARRLVARGFAQDDANGQAWAFGKRKLEEAIASGLDFAFETTLGANTIPRLLAEAAATHDVIMIFCGLASVQMHVDRVKFRVENGGHDIPLEKIVQRWTGSRENLIGLLPHLAGLQVFDNSATVAEGEKLPSPILVLEMRDGRMMHPGPDSATSLAATPGWAKPMVAAALRLDRTHRRS
jgi:predicted ABC-type ATPase